MILEPTSWSLVPEILAILKDKWPHSKASYYILKQTAEDLIHLRDAKYLLLTPGGKVDRYGTFVISFPGEFFSFFVETFNPELGSLTNAIANCPSLEWGRDHVINSGPIPERLNPLFDDLQDLLNYKKALKSDTVSYHLTTEEAKNTAVSIPDDVSLGLLREEHSKIVNDVWPHRRGEESRLKLAEFIRLGRASGLFKKDGGKLVSWCFILPYGGPAILQTDEEEKGKGYGEAMLRATTRKLGESGIEPQAFIVVGNSVSIKLFTKLNYKPGYAARCIIVVFFLLVMELKEASWDIVPDILNILMSQWPDTKTACSMLKGYNELRIKFPDLECTFLTPDGQIEKFGTFVLVFPGDLYGFYTDTLNPDWQPLLTGLMNSKHIDWNRTVTWGPCHSRLFPLVEEATKRMKLKFTDICAVRSFHISNAEAKATTYELPDDLYFADLREEHARLVNSLWPHGVGEDSVQEVKDYIKHRKCLGLYRKETDKLLAWCLHIEYGGPGLLHVLPEEQKKGYGELTLRVFTKHLGELGLDPQAFILPHNEASIRLFTKLGYKAGYKTTWFTVDPMGVVTH